MSTTRTISDIIFEYETYEYSRENLQNTKDILNLELLEHKLEASEFYNNNVEMITESVSEDFYMEKFEKVKEMGKKIKEKAINIGNTIKTGLKKMIDIIVKFIQKKMASFDDIIRGTDTIRKYLKNKPYNEKIANVIKKQCDSFPKDIGVIKSDSILNAEWNSNIGDLSGYIKLAIDKELIFYIDIENSSSDHALPLNVLIRLINDASRCDSSSIAGVKASLEHSLNPNGGNKKLSQTNSIKFNEKTMNAYMRELKRISARLDKNIQKKSADNATDLKEINEVFSRLKTITGKTMDIYNDVINFRKKFCSQVLKVILNPFKGKNNTDNSTGNALNGGEAKTESFDDFDFSLEEADLDFIL